MPADDEESARLAYDRTADAYAQLFTATEPEQPMDLAMIDHFAGLLPAPRRVLDAGCGAGRMMPYLAERGCRPEGIDLSSRMILNARRNHPHYRFTVGSLRHLGYPDDSFDGVFSWYSTIHNPDEDLAQILAEMARVTRPGGLVLLAFQVGHGVRRVGKYLRAASGHDVTLNRYHRSVAQIISQLERCHLSVAATMQRAPHGSEVDPQAVVIGARD